MTRHRSTFAALCLLAALAACGTSNAGRDAGAPSDTAPDTDETPGLVSLDFEGVSVALDRIEGALRVTAGDTLLAEIAASSFAVRRAAATYTTQFGMFDIREQADEDWRPALAFGEATSESESLSFPLLDEAGAPLLHATLRSPREGTVALELRAEDPAHNRVRLAWDCLADEHFAGFGAQSHDVDHRGQIIPLFVSEQGIGKRDDNELPVLWFVEGRRHTTHIPVPAAVSSRGAAWHVETTAFSQVDLCASDPERIGVEVWEGAPSVFFYAGPTPIEALSRYTAEVGRPRMPPPWAFAPWNDTFGGRQALLDFAAFLRDNELPSSAIWCEDWRGGGWVAEGYRISLDWRLDPELYPDFEDLLAELRAQGFLFQSYFNTFVYQNSDVWEEALAEGHLVTRTDGSPYTSQGPASGFPVTGLADLTSPATWDWVKSFLVEALEMGIRGWMADYAEWLPVDDVVLASGEDPALAHNAYPLLWQQLNQEAVAETGLEDEVCIFHRSGYNRSQGLAHIIWGGDQRTSFHTDDGLPTIVPIGLGLAATGFPFYAHDVAGYQSATNPPATKELFFRWTQLSAWSPVMRTHHGIAVKDNWNLARDEETIELWRRYTELHVRLYPFWRALARRAVDHGEPLWRPLGFHHPEDAQAWGLLDQLYVGEAVLVAPVVEDGARERQVYLPAGRFTHFPAGGEALVGPTTVTVAAPLDEIPVFLAAGGLLPLTATPAQSLLPGLEGIAGLESTEGDRVLYVGLGAEGFLEEESGASYRLEGAGTETSGLSLDAEGAVILTGDGAIEGGGFTLTLEDHPPTRRTTVYLR